MESKSVEIMGIAREAGVRTIPAPKKKATAKKPTKKTTK